MIYKCDWEYRQTQRQPSFCAHSACVAWVYKIREELTGLFWPYDCRETFPWHSWDEDEITWSTRMSVCLVPHSLKSYVWKSPPSSSPEHLPWPYPLISHPCQSMQWTASLPLSEDVEQDAFRWGGGGGHRTWAPVTVSPFWLTEENWALGRLTPLRVCVPCPETLGRRHYTFSSLLMFRVEVLQVIEGMGSPEASQVRVTCSSSSMAVWFST